MKKFAFIIHPLEVADIIRKFKFFKFLPGRLVENLLSFSPVFKVSEIRGIKSAYSETAGWFVVCPLTSRKMLSLPENTVIEKIVSAGKLAEKLGAEIVGLGAMTSVVGDAGVTIARNLNIAVTSGNSYTVATALEGTRKAAEIMGINMSRANVAVIGATGSIGSVCARIIAAEAGSLTLVARRPEKLERLSYQILMETGIAARLTTNVSSALKEADIVITVTSAVDTVIRPDDLKTGAVVCDVARPRDVSKQVAEKRPDVLVIEGGVVEVPGEAEFNFNFGFPGKMAYACMAETIILALEGRCESFTLGRDLTVEQVREISSLAAKHGFKLAGFRSFERALSESDIEKVRIAAVKKSTKSLTSCK